MSLVLRVPKTSLVVLCGPAGCGKSTFASRWFKETQIVSSDRCRALVSDSEENQAATPQAFRVFHCLIEQRLTLGRLTVADSTALVPRARRDLLRQARRHDFQAVLVVFNFPEELCQKYNASRQRVVDPGVVSRHHRLLQQALQTVYREGFDLVYVITPEDLPSLRVEVVPLPVEVPLDGPFDLIGDVHGCLEELEELLQKLGYRKVDGTWQHPEGRKAVFLGDLGDRGPHNLASIKLVMDMVEAGYALFVPGNHDKKLAGYLTGRQVQVTHGLEKTVEELERLEPEQREAFARRFLAFYSRSVPYLVLDGGRLVAVHGAIKERMIGRLSPRIASYCLYGEATGRVTPEGLPERRDWAGTYRGKALVVYGHTPVPEPVFRGRTINIDQGCVMGGKLTALRYPEREVVQVPARRVYYTPGDGEVGAWRK
ncbi:AAA family ATPase [Desulfovirgula thermocuniculi]|uniref:AAA family ATPase n=1 Tax=Desulfovirgula thermocuniculi TaxID=348842 RepID=UPI00040571EF|nr:AAA family ATPase [Desulfovirgula thermocuniculi]